jgi:hypothetical protein
VGIGQPDPAGPVVEQDRGRPEVAVDDPGGVRGGDRVGDQGRELDRHRRGQWCSAGVAELLVPVRGQHLHHHLQRSTGD